jgi:hypothetical protein
MSIPVVCPGCLARFKVSEKFAGRSGACPKCKGTINVPSKEEEVKVHAPEDFGRGGRGASGALSLKPIARIETRLTPVAVAAVVAAVLGAVAIAWLAGGLLQSFWPARVLALLVISPPLVVAPYTFLRDQELEPYRGKAFYLRAGICALAYTVLWGVFGYASDFAIGGDPWNWLLVIPPFVVTGALVALACFDLDFGGGCFHYAFYVLAILLLRWCAGMGWIWEAAA